jgi:hypothetical protein
MFSTIPPTTLLTWVISALLGIVAAGATVYLLALLFSAFTNAFGGLFERATFQRYGARCAQGDALLEKGNFPDAMQAFANAFFLKPLRRDSELLSDIANYHTGLLSRLLTIADEMGNGRARLPALATTDRLLAERLELQLEYFRSRKRKDRTQLRELERRLRENQTQVRLSITQLLEEIRSSEERMFYH